MMFLSDLNLVPFFNDSFKIVVKNSFCSVCAQLQTSVSFQSERYMIYLCSFFFSCCLAFQAQELKSLLFLSKFSLAVPVTFFRVACFSSLIRNTLFSIQSIGFWKNSLNANGFALTPTVTEMFKTRFIFVSFQFGIRTCEGWNFNSGNYLFTTDTKQIHVSKFYCTSVQSPALCTTHCQRCGSRRIPLAAPVVLIVRMELSTA